MYVSFCEQLKILCSALISSISSDFEPSYNSQTFYLARTFLLSIIHE